MRSDSRLGGWLAARDGAVALILAAILAGLAGLVALAVDLGRAWNLGTELQAAVDAAALAGASQLDGKAGARVRAMQAASGALAHNRQIFAREPGVVTFDQTVPCEGDGCVLSNENFRFLSALAPRLDASSDAEARFIEVRATRNVRFAFAGLVGAPAAAAPHSRAVAGWTRLVCGQAALLVCNPDEPAGNRDPFHDFVLAGRQGRGITLTRPAAPDSPAPGEFAWLAPVTCDPARDTCTAEVGLPALQDALGQVLSPQVCLDAGGRMQAAGLDQAGAFLNMRMDVYSAGGAPAYRDDPAYQPSPNFLTGLVADPAAGPACDFDVATGGAGSALTVPDNPFLGPDRHAPHGAAPLDHMGYPRDNCAYPRADGAAPADSCIFAPPPGSGLEPGRQVGTGLWDLDAYMAFHHPGISYNTLIYNECPGTGCVLGGDAAVDRDGDGRLSRWEVYAWEGRGHPPRFGRPQCFGGGLAGLPQPPADGDAVADRRLIGALVVNCNALAHAGTGGAVPLAGADPALNIFLTEAVGELAPDALYGEIVAPAAVDGRTAVSHRDRLVLYE